MRGASREEKAILVPAINGLLLAYHEERHNKICEEMPQLPSTGQPDSHLLAELAQLGHSMVLPHLGA